MSYGAKDNPYSYSPSGYAPMAAEADTWERSSFIRRTYLHLGLAVGAFAMIEAVIFTMFDQATRENAIMSLLGFSSYSWLIVLGAFMAVSWVANAWASHGGSRTMQYMGLTLYVVAEALIFVPLLHFANRFAPDAIPSAGIMTGVIFGGLTAVVLITKKDFSFLRMFLCLGAFAALGFIVVAVVLQLDMFGVLFATAMIVLSSGYILYYTSNVLHHYRTNQHVAASLALFASVALLFWYVLQLFLMSRD